LGFVHIDFWTKPCGVTIFSDTPRDKDFVIVHAAASASSIFSCPKNNANLEGIAIAMPENSTYR
jgi:hypothetical protein